MTWTVPEALQERLEDASVEPVIVARINLPAAAWLTVVDWTVGSGDTIWVEDPSFTLTEGVDFNAFNSNAATAQSITNAWNSNSTRLAASQVRAHWRGGDHVLFVRMPRLDTPVLITTSDANAWDEVRPANPTTFSFCSHIGKLPDAFSGEDEAIPVVAHLSGLEWTMDPVTRAVEIPRVDLEFSGGQEIRELMNWYQLRRAQVELFLGTDDLTDATTDYVQLPSLFIEDVVPGAGRLTLKLIDALGDAWRDRTVSGAWTCWHPLQIVEDIVTRAGAVDGVHFDFSTLDPVTADATRSHFCLSRYDDQLILEENRSVDSKPAGEMVTELVALMSGTLRPTQTGAYEFFAFNYGASAVGTLDVGAVTGHDVDEVDQEGTLGRQINVCTVKLDIRDDGKSVAYTESDLLSQYEAGGLLSDFEFRTEWLNGVARLGISFRDLDGTLVTVHDRYDPDNDPQGVPLGSYRIENDTISFPVDFAGRQGFSGTQKQAGSQAFVAGMSLGSAVGRYVVLRVSADDNTQREDQANEAEYLLIDRWDLWDQTLDHPNVQGAPAGAEIPGQNTLIATITNDSAGTVLPNGETIGDWFGAGTEVGLRTGRGLTPTSTPEWWYSFDSVADAVVPITPVKIIDITIPVYMAKEIVRRWRNGAPKISVRTNLSHIHYELGEFITLADDDIVTSYLRGEGATPQVIWEVTGKKLDIFGDTPGMEYELVYVRDTALTQPPVLPALAPPPLVVPGVNPGTETVNPQYSFTLKQKVVRSAVRHPPPRGGVSKVFGPPWS